MLGPTHFLSFEAGLVRASIFTQKGGVLQMT